MKKLPYGINDYEKLVEGDYYYVDKTKYIEELENWGVYVRYVRPKSFGKTLFLSMLENYYDVKKKDEFQKLFGETYIGKNPTEMKNSYFVLKFNFSNLNTENIEKTLESFRNIVRIEADIFCKKYDLELNIEEDDEAAIILKKVFSAVNLKNIKENCKNKIYVIIDNYDNFANEIAEFDIENIDNISKKYRTIKCFYEILKEGTEGVVYRIFITGVLPICLVTLFGGINILLELTRDMRLGEMMGFTEGELIKIMEEQKIDKEKQKELLEIIKENYGGYEFLTIPEKCNNLYNPTMCLYFLNTYINSGKISEKLLDEKEVEDLKNTFNFLKDEKDIIEKIANGEEVLVDLPVQFDSDRYFGENEILSTLYYLGYLTINKQELWGETLKLPNQIMKTMLKSVS